MRSTMNLSLPPELKKWVDAQAKQGGFGTASEFLRDMLRRAKQREARRQIDVMLVEAVESGATTVMGDADWASIHKAAKSAANARRKVKR